MQTSSTGTTPVTERSVPVWQYIQSIWSSPAWNRWLNGIGCRGPPSRVVVGVDRLPLGGSGRTRVLPLVALGLGRCLALPHGLGIDGLALLLLHM